MFVDKARTGVACFFVLTLILTSNAGVLVDRCQYMIMLSQQGFPLTGLLITSATCKARERRP